MRRCDILPLLLLVLPSPWYLWGQAPCPRQTIAASVIDRQGDPIPGLDASSFKGEFRGKPVRILSASLDEQPRRILLLLDASSSMTQEFKWDFAIDLASDFVTRVAPSASLALVTFSTKVEEKIDFPADRSLLLARLRQLASERRGVTGLRTSLRDTFSEVIKWLEPAAYGDTIYLITDGGDNKSKMEWNNVQQALLHANPRLFVFLLNDAAFQFVPHQQQVELEDIRRVAEKTGGLVLVAPESVNLMSYSMEESFAKVRQKLAALMPPLYRQMTELYRLQVELPQPVGKTGSWKLELVDGGRIKKRQTRLFYRRELLPCTDPNSHP